MCERYLIQKVNANADQALTERDGVFTLPTTLIVDSGGTVKRANYGLTEAVRLANQPFAHEHDAAR